MKTIWLVSSVFDIIPLFLLNTTYDHEPIILQNRFLQNKAKQLDDTRLTPLCRSNKKQQQQQQNKTEIIYQYHYFFKPPSPVHHYHHQYFTNP